MSFLKNFLNAKEDGVFGDWKVLNKEEQLDQIIKDSHEKPVVLFKHSVSCGISGQSKYKLESNWNFSKEDLDFYYLDLLSYRSVSNKIADMFGVIHQSPQVIVLKEGKVVYHTSHHDISVAGIARALG